MKRPFNALSGGFVGASVRADALTITHYDSLGTVLYSSRVPPRAREPACARHENFEPRTQNKKLAMPLAPSLARPLPPLPLPPQLELARLRDKQSKPDIGQRFSRWRHEADWLESKTSQTRPWYAGPHYYRRRRRSSTAATTCS